MNDLVNSNKVIWTRDSYKLRTFWIQLEAKLCLKNSPQNTSFSVLNLSQEIIIFCRLCTLSVFFKYFHGKKLYPLFKLSLILYSEFHRLRICSDIIIFKSILTTFKKQALFFEAAGPVAKIGLNLKSNHNEQILLA